MAVRTMGRDAEFHFHPGGPAARYLRRNRGNGEEYGGRGRPLNVRKPGDTAERRGTGSLVWRQRFEVYRHFLKSLHKLFSEASY